MAKNTKDTKKNNTGFAAPAYGRPIKDNEKVIVQPNGRRKIVKK